jgi:pimeloyl-ACP methyl ester carboxylesterase
LSTLHATDTRFQPFGSAKNWVDIHFTSRDGLRLYGRHYPAPGSMRRPLLCLAGLTRNCRDFHDLATVLSDPRGHRRDVFALDARGRGRSEYARDRKTYTVEYELADALDFMTLCSLSHTAVLGTSRGGILAMLMATQRPASLGAVVLNDIGPVIEREGLARIIAYVGRVPTPANWQEATHLMRNMNEKGFPAIPLEQWEAIARQSFNESDGRPSPGYDPVLSEALMLGNGPIPNIWPQFLAMKNIPVMAIRGATSDLFSAATLQEMQRRHPQLEALTIAGEGHAPMLKDVQSIGAIYDFLLRADAVQKLQGLKAAQ